MKKQPLITILATLGVLAICWMVLPHWIVGVLAFLSILIAVYIGEKIDKSSEQITVPVTIRQHSTEWRVEPLAEIIEDNSNEETMPNLIPEGLFTDLYLLSIDEAIEQGIINDIGDEDGTFIYWTRQGDERSYRAIIQGYNIHITVNAAEAVQQNSNTVGELVFGYDDQKRRSLVELGKTISFKD